ncbi:hypothetical protein HDU97_008792 [Phlyctochytrium planicorne]|nr:hypothetical protein HDU97_008792 [Phlyctochytrium planicorne]
MILFNDYINPSNLDPIPTKPYDAPETPKEILNIIPHTKPYPFPFHSKPYKVSTYLLRNLETVQTRLRKYTYSLRTHNVTFGMTPHHHQKVHLENHKRLKTCIKAKIDSLRAEGMFWLGHVRAARNGLKGYIVNGEVVGTDGMWGAMKEGWDDDEMEVWCRDLRVVYAGDGDEWNDRGSVAESEKGSRKWFGRSMSGLGTFGRKRKIDDACAEAALI